MTIQRYEFIQDYGGSKIQPSPTGDFVLFADVPVPPPLLERPDGSGWWRLIEPEETYGHCVLVNTLGGIWTVHFVDDEESHFVDETPGLWQRIPDAVVPKIPKPV